jgi:hypothetical protein
MTPHKETLPPTIYPGAVFVYLTVIGFHGRDKDGRQLWMCECRCGKNIPIHAGRLKSGNTKSCGCLKVEQFKIRVTKHGHSVNRKLSREFTTWRGMKARCEGEGRPDWKHYGGRGIKVCERWQVFENFLADMGEKPPKMSIDRIDNEKDYEPGNCKWSTQKEQVHNRRKKTHCIRGHLLSPENCYVCSWGRHCLVCKKQRAMGII